MAEVILVIFKHQEIGKHYKIESTEMKNLYIKIGTQYTFQDKNVLNMTGLEVQTCYEAIRGQDLDFVTEDFFFRHSTRI